MCVCVFGLITLDAALYYHRDPSRVAKLDTFVTKLKSQRDYLRHLVSIVRCG